MNNKGAVFVLFIILIPLILMIIGIIFETTRLSYEKRRLYSISKTIIASNIDNPQKDDIIDLYHRNGIYENIHVNLEDGIKIEFTYNMDSSLGKIIGKDKYQIKIKIKGVKKEDVLTFEKGS